MKPTRTRWRHLLPHTYYGEHSIGPKGLTVRTDREGVVTSEVMEAHADRMRLLPAVWREESYPDPAWREPAESSAASAAPNTAPVAVEPAPASGEPMSTAAEAPASADPSTPVRRGPGRPPKPRG